MPCTGRTSLTRPVHRKFLREAQGYSPSSSGDCAPSTVPSNAILTIHASSAWKTEGFKRRPATVFGDIFGGVRLGFVDRPACFLWPTVSLDSVLCMDRGAVNRKRVPLADPWCGISVGGGGVALAAKSTVAVTANSDYRPRIKYQRKMCISGNFRAARALNSQIKSICLHFRYLLHPKKQSLICFSPEGRICLGSELKKFSM